MTKAPAFNYGNNNISRQREYDDQALFGYNDNQSRAPPTLAPRTPIRTIKTPDKSASYNSKSLMGSINKTIDFSAPSDIQNFVA